MKLQRLRQFRLFQGIAAIVVFCCAAGNGIAFESSSSSTLPVLQTAQAAHSLTSEEAARHYPVHLHATVTYYDPYIDTRHAALFVCDKTGCIFVAVNFVSDTPAPPGTVVDLQGVSAPGDFAPIVDRASLRVTGKANLPTKAPRVVLSSLLTGAYDGQWVEIEGIVKAVRTSRKNVLFDLVLTDGAINAITVQEPGVDYAKFADSKVKLRANAAPVFNRHLQMVGARLFLPNVSQIEIEQAAPADPFSLPLLALDRLMRYTPNLPIGHRVHVQARASLQWPGRMLCVQNAKNGLCVDSAQRSPVADGALVDLVGFPASGGLTPTLTDVVFRSAGDIHPIPPIRATAETLLRGDYDSRLVEIDGKVIGTDRAAKDPTMVLSSGSFLFQVVAPGDHGRSLLAWKEGSILRVTGICAVEVEHNSAIGPGFSATSSFRILLRTPEDVQVLKEPSWWTAANLVPVLIAVLALSLAALGWVAVLRHRVAEQTVVIQAQMQTLSELSFQDGLTRLANRRKFDEVLAAEYRQAVSSLTPISLLMLDIDYFKALNDEYGHQRGDECLVQVAAALAAAVIRKTDLVARYGGEEFAVILPGCYQEDALLVAERMRVAVQELAFTHVRSPFNQRVSISIGAATVIPTEQVTPSLLVRLADQALYQSKQSGRNCTTAAQNSLAEYLRVPQSIAPERSEADPQPAF